MARLAQRSWCDRGSVGFCRPAAVRGRTGASSPPAQRAVSHSLIAMFLCFPSYTEAIQELITYFNSDNDQIMGAGINDPAAVTPGPSPRLPPASSPCPYVQSADQLQTNIKANTEYCFILFFFLSSFSVFFFFFFLSLARCFFQGHNSNKGEFLLRRTRSSCNATQSVPRNGSAKGKPDAFTNTRPNQTCQHYKP